MRNSLSPSQTNHKLRPCSESRDSKQPIQPRRHKRTSKPTHFRRQLRDRLLPKHPAVSDPIPYFPQIVPTHQDRYGVRSTQTCLDRQS